jgi:hypothetical protein
MEKGVKMTTEGFHHNIFWANIDPTAVINRVENLWKINFYFINKNFVYCPLFQTSIFMIPSFFFVYLTA